MIDLPLRRGRRAISVKPQYITIIAVKTDDLIFLDDLYFDNNLPLDVRRRHLSHWDQPNKLVFLTFRLADSLPQEVLRRFAEEKAKWLSEHPQPWSEEDLDSCRSRFAGYIDRWLDAGCGDCVLRIPQAADVMEKALRFFNGKRYVLHGYVVMSNHVHVLVQVFDGWSWKTVVHSWKSYTATEINKIAGRKGRLWFEETYDRLIRDKAHYVAVIDYMEKNRRHGGVRCWLKDIHGLPPGS